jgi:hypothetical protein
MSGSFKAYHDTLLTRPVTSGDPFTMACSYDGSSGNVDSCFYFGSADAARTAQAYSNPGVDQLALSVVDSDVGTGQPATLFKVALTQGGLAVANQSVNLGTSILGGTANAVTVWVRANISNGVATIGTTTDLSFSVLGLSET